MAQQKKLEVVKQETKFSFKKTLISVGIGAIIGSVVWLVVDKFKVHEVVCEIVGADQEAAIVAARCLIK